MMKLSVALYNFHPSQGENSCMVGKKNVATLRGKSSQELERVLTHFWEPVYGYAQDSLIPLFSSYMH